MYPAASVSGLYFAHAEARYFAVDLITRDQVERLRPPQGHAARRGRALAGPEPGLRSLLTSTHPLPPGEGARRASEGLGSARADLPHELSGPGSAGSSVPDFGRTERDSGWTDSAWSRQ